MNKDDTTKLLDCRFILDVIVLLCGDSSNAVLKETAIVLDCRFVPGVNVSLCGDSSSFLLSALLKDQRPIRHLVTMDF